MRHRLSFAVCAATCVLASSTAALAQNRLDAESNWRRHTREGRENPSQLTAFTFEVRFGGYYPKVDEEPGLNGTPFFDVYGNGPQFYFGLEVDWLPVRIPYVGKLGPALGWGLSTMSAKLKVTSTDATTGESKETEVGESSTLFIHAATLSAVLRIDEISRRTVLPIVPYGKVGIGFGSWTASTSAGTSKVGTDCKVKTPTNCIQGEGGSVGPHFALGGMLGLNWLDPRSGSMGRQSLGITQAYLFGEWMLDDLSSAIGKQGAMNVGTSSWVLGLALDL